MDLRAVGLDGIRDATRNNPASILLPVIPVKALSLLLGDSGVDGSGTQPFRIAFFSEIGGFCG